MKLAAFCHILTKDFKKTNKDNNNKLKPVLSRIRESAIDQSRARPAPMVSWQRAAFPALFISGLYLGRVLTGSLDCLCFVIG